MREKLIEQLRMVAEITPPLCQYDHPEEVEIFGKKIMVYCKPYEELQSLIREALDALETPKTNGDRIRAMSDEELAVLFHGFCENGDRCFCCPLYEKNCAGVHSDELKWLEFMQQPAEGE